VAESANAGLGDYKFPASESQRDPAFLFRTFGFEDSGIAFNRRDAAAFQRLRVEFPGVYEYKTPQGLTANTKIEMHRIVQESKNNYTAKKKRRSERRREATANICRTM
jgi:hypothetical protein